MKSFVSNLSFLSNLFNEKRYHCSGIIFHALGFILVRTYWSYTKNLEVTLYRFLCSHELAKIYALLYQKMILHQLIPGNQT
jgi:hypothetical protein